MLKRKTIILPIGGGGSSPQTGTLRIVSEGTYDVSQYAEVDVDVEYTNNYFCLTTREDNASIELEGGAHSNKYFEYSTDKLNWTVWDHSALTIAHAGDKLYFRGDNPNGLSSSTSNYTRFKLTKTFDVSGDIMTLLSHERELVMPNYCFCYLLSNSSVTNTIIDASNLVLPNYVTTSCYSYMFQYQTGLLNTPALPATTLANYCYAYMFRGCTSLTTAPELPATTLVTHCYEGMFFNCSSLNDVTTYAENWDESNYTVNWLAQVPQSGTFKKLIHTTIPTNAPSGIPYGWTVSVLDLEYFNFEDISGSNNTLTLTRNNSNGQCPVVVLEYSTDSVNWQEWQAVNDVRTYTIPANGKFYLRGNNTAFGQNANGYDYHQFASTGNIEAHGNIMTLLDKTGQSTTITSTGCFRSLFRNMTTLKTAPELPATNLNNAAYIYMFLNTGITEAPDLPATRIGNGYYYGMFYKCTSLTKAAKMTINEFISGHVNACREMYIGCSTLTDISGITINATSFTESAFQHAFDNCTSLTKAIPMTIASVRGNTFAWMYNGCSSLTDISGVCITATTATWGSFKVMFKGTAITESPDLSSLTSFYANSSDLGKGSLTQMFQNCSNLSKITVGCSTWDTDFADQWVSGVAATGDFYNLGQATIPTGTNGIPTGWTEHTQIPVTFLSYIHKDVLENQMDSAAKSSDKINTLICPPNGNYSFRLKGKFKGYYTGLALCGVVDQNDPYSADDVKFRVFSYSGIKYFDCGSRRFNTYRFTYDEDVDITVTNCNYHDNITGFDTYTATTQTITPRIGYTFLVDLSTWWLKSVEIFDENGNTVFNGTAALENGVYGLWDSVTNQMFTNTTINIVGEV